HGRGGCTAARGRPGGDARPAQAPHQGGRDAARDAAGGPVLPWPSRRGERVVHRAALRGARPARRGVPRAAHRRHLPGPALGRRAVPGGRRRAQRRGPDTGRHDTLHRAGCQGDMTRTPGFDTSVAHQARMYDYLLGGKDNYAADRAAVEATLKIYPDAAFTARANRAFLGRVIRYLAGEAGIRQFLDIGTGIPTAGNTHEIAQAIAPES